MSLPIITKQQFVEKSKYFPKGKLTLFPFSVGQESLFLQVKDTTDEKEKMEAMKQIITECVQEKIQVGELPLFVIEYLFLLLRQKSIGEIVELGYICKNEVEIIAPKDEYGIEPTPVKKECGGRIDLKIDLRDVKLIEDEGHENKIMVTDKLGLKFKYPTINSIVEKVDGISENDIIISSIESIYDKEGGLWQSTDHTFEEMKEFYNNVSLLKKAEIAEKFFGKLPHINYKKEITCGKCGKVHPIEFNSLNEIFR